MAKSAVIGSLRINLGLDSGQLQTGLKNATSSLDNMAKRAAAFGAAIGAAMAGAAVALGSAVRNTINQADEMAKSAQKFGVGVEELSRLKHAADLSGVSMEGLGTGLRVLSRNLQEFANGANNSAAQAFKALGIEAKNADGSLKSSSQVMTEVAARFARMEDGAQKTALAMAIFGRSGADLIPMLNAGADGLASMMAEADQLGIVLDTRTAKAAEAFNDNMTRIGRVWDGLVLKLSAHLLPALESLSEALLGFVNDEAMVQAAAEGMGSAFKWIAEMSMRLVAGIRGVRAEIAGLAAAGSKLMGGDLTGAKEAWNAGQDEAVRIMQDMERRISEGIFSGTSQGSIQRRISDAFATAGGEAGDRFVANFEDATSEGKGGGRARAALDTIARDAARIFEATRTPLENYQAQIARLNELLAAGAINQDTYNRAVLQAQDAFDQAEKAGRRTENVFQQIGQTIGQTFASAFSSIIDGSKKVGDVIADLMRQLGQMLMSRAFQSLIGFLFPGGAPILNSGGGFRGLIGYANGTSFHKGGLAMVGERGPELVNMPRGAQVIPNRALREGAGGEAVDININVSGARGNAEIMEMVSAGVRQGITAYDRDVAPSTVHRVVNDPRARG